MKSTGVGGAGCGAGGGVPAGGVLSRRSPPRQTQGQEPRGTLPLQLRAHFTRPERGLFYNEFSLQVGRRVLVCTRRTAVGHITYGYHVTKRSLGAALLDKLKDKNRGVRCPSRPERGLFELEEAYFYIKGAFVKMNGLHLMMDFHYT